VLRATIFQVVACIAIPNSREIQGKIQKKCINFPVCKYEDEHKNKENGEFLGFPYVSFIMEG
jgi:hypothetical protein